MKKNDKYETEYEINISDIKIAKKMLELLGIKFTDYYEKIREAYYYKNSEIAIDYYPGLHNLLQIESPTEKEMLSIAKKLKLNLNTTMSNPLIYYGIDSKKFEKLMPITFTNFKNVKNLVTKHKREYNKIIKEQISADKDVNRKK